MPAPRNIVVLGGTQLSGRSSCASRSRRC